jgi:hypothetical protein
MPSLGAILPNQIITVNRMAVMDWIVDNAVWLMLFSNLFSLVVGYWIGTELPKNNRADPQAEAPDRSGAPPD